MNTKAKFALAALALLGLGAAGGGGAAQQGTGTPGGGGGGGTPQRTPTPPPGPPPSVEGEERDDDEGRAWGTFYANRNERKHWELRVFSVAASASDAAIGAGEVIVDVYETIVANAAWEWHGQACGGSRWRLVFSAGHLQGKPTVISSLPCSSVRPFPEVLRQQMTFVQVGPDVLLIVDTNSGINKRSPDSIANGPNGGVFNDSGDAKWDNRYVASGYVTLDAAWVFNPKE